MTGVGGKRQLNIKLEPESMDLIEKAAYVLRKTKGQVVQEAMTDYAKKHNLLGQYQLHIREGMLVLLRLDAERATIIEMERLNGTPPDVIAQRYSARFHQPVKLVETEGVGEST